MSKSDDYRALLRLETKRQRLLTHLHRLNKRIAQKRGKMAGKKYRWGNCSCKGNRNLT